MGHVLRIFPRSSASSGAVTPTVRRTRRDCERPRGVLHSVSVTLLFCGQSTVSRAGRVPHGTSARSSGQHATGAFFVCLAVLCTVGTAGQPPRIDTSTIGPQVGQKVPDFSGTDQQGRTHTLASALGAKGAMLVFFRSADW
jgi:hypothetical protein